MTTQSVAQKPAGNTPDPKAQTNVSPSGKGELPADRKVSSETLTQTQLEAAIHAVQSESGRKIAALEKERNQFKADAERLTAELADNAKDIETLQTKFEEMAKDDPEKFNVAKELKALREERRQLKTDRLAVDAERGELEPYRQEKRTRDIFEIAQEYEVDSYDKLYNLCDSFGAKTEEDIRKAADILWVKKDVGQKKSDQKPPMNPVSGVTRGGGDTLSSLSPKDRTREADYRLRTK